MARGSCRNCGSSIGKQDHFCGKCGMPTELGIKALSRGGKIDRILLQLDRSHEVGRLSKERYETLREQYQAGQAELRAMMPERFPMEAQKPEEAKKESVKTDVQPEGAKRSVVYGNPLPLPWFSAAGYIMVAGILVLASVFLVSSIMGGKLQ